VNSLGNMIAPVAIAFAVLDLGGSATQLGLVVGAYALADVVAVLWGGVLGDRLPRTVMMRGANLAAGLVQGTVALTLLTDHGSLWLLAGGGALNGALGSLAGPSTQAVTPQTVPDTVLRQAIALRRLSQNTAMIVGSGVAGLLVAWIGTGGALLVDAVTFLVAAGCFSRIHVPALPPAVRTHALTEAREGFREVMRHSWLWSLIAMALVYHLFYGGSQGVLGPIVVGEHIGRAAWGYALSAMMIGFVAGGLVSLVWKPRRALLVGELFLMLTICFPLAMAISDNVWVVLAGACLHGFGLEIFSVGWDLSIQENVPEHMLARVYSFDQLGSFIARPLGLALTGPLASAVGERHWLLVVAAAMAVSEIAPFVVRDVRRLERRPVLAEAV
jgi:MFS family permease